MSEIIQTNDNWGKLQRAMESMTPAMEEQIKKELKVSEVCVQGLAVSSGSSSFNKFAKDMGFTKEERTKIRACVVNGCPYSDTLFNLLNHCIGYHKAPIPHVAKLIPVIKSDTTKPDTSFKNSVQTNHMRAD